MPNEPSSAPHPNRRGRATEERIHEAALHVLADRGLDLTVEEVAERAGTTRMTVYRHVGSRSDLLLRLVIEATDRFAERLAVILDADEPFAARLEDALVYVVTSTRSAPDRQAIALATADPTGEWGAIDTEGRVMAEVLEFLQPRLEAGAAETPFRAGVDETLTWLLRQVQLYLLVPGPFGDDEDALRHELRTFVVPAVLVDP